MARGASNGESRFNWAPAALTLISIAATLGLRVNPWPRDGWFQTQYFLVGSFPGHDDYSPIAAPALLYRGAHAIAALMGLDLAGEFYVSSIMQNMLLLLSACFIYCTLKLMGIRTLAGPLAAGFLLFVVSTGLAQSFYSEDAALFLMSAVVLIVVAVPLRAATSNAKFRGLAILCGVLVGLLVVTRMTPIFLIPGIALFFLGRMPVRRVAEFTGTVALLTALLMAGSILGNHARFGRYELTNSSGRHLWEGVSAFADEALAQAGDYRQLEGPNAHLDGLNWWEVPPGGTFTVADPREPVLGKLAKQAIRNAPGRYLMEGAKKFATTIGAPPYRLGYLGAGKHWNPLQRTDFLPSLSSAMHVTAYGQLMEVVLRRLYIAFGWAYPITVFAIALTWLAMAAELLHRRVRRRTLSISTYLVAGIPLVALPVLSEGPKLDAVLGSLVCTVLLGVSTAVLLRIQRPRQQIDVASSASPISCFSFFALMFFGSLWFSWQIEMANSRNTIPYLPFWLVMLAMAGTYWRNPGHAFGETFAFMRKTLPGS
ncbi:MAG: hypothetical protein WDO56_18355 [Gammaproteobacteria bacterium]